VDVLFKKGGGLKVTTSLTIKEGDQLEVIQCGQYFRLEFFGLGCTPPLIAFGQLSQAGHVAIYFVEEDTIEVEETAVSDFLDHVGFRYTDVILLEVYPEGMTFDEVEQKLRRELDDEDERDRFI